MIVILRAVLQGREEVETYTPPMPQEAPPKESEFTPVEVDATVMDMNCGVSLVGLQTPKVFLDTLAYVEGLMGRKLVWEESTKLERIMQMPKEAVDERVPPKLETCFKWVEADYREARQKADVVLFYPHAGGQFNVEPGTYTKELVRMSAELGFDAVFAGHAHTSQRAEFVNGKPCFYSMGNISMSPGTFYSVPECLPEYGLAAYMYIGDKRIQKTTFSIFKMVQEEGVPMRIIPVDDLYTQLTGQAQQQLAAEVSEIYTRVTGNPTAPTIPQKEYNLQ